MSKLASRRQKVERSKALPARPKGQRKTDAPGGACHLRSLDEEMRAGGERSDFWRLKDCARVYTNRIFLRCEAFLRLRTRIFFALCQANEQVHARKNAVKSSREKRCLAQSSRLPSRHPNRKTFGYQTRSCAGGAAFLPALDRGQEAIDRAHRSNAQCADVCKKLRSPDGFCRGVSFHLNKKLPGKCCMTGNNIYPRDKFITSNFSASDINSWSKSWGVEERK